MNSISMHCLPLDDEHDANNSAVFKDRLEKSECKTAFKQANITQTPEVPIILSTGH